MRKRIDLFYQYPAALFFFISLLINGDVFLGPFCPIRIHDSFDSWFVDIKIVGSHLFQYGFSAWNPNTVCGNNTLIGGYHFLNPILILSAFLPLWLVSSLLKIGACFLGGYGMFLCLSEVFFCSRVASYAGSILFLSSISTMNLVYPTYLLPLYLYLFNKIFNTKSPIQWRHCVILLILFLISFTHLTVPFFPLFHLLIILTAGYPFNKVKRQLIGFIGIWAIYGLIHAPIIYTDISEMMYSQRLSSVGLLDRSFSEYVLSYLPRDIFLLYYSIIPAAFFIITLFDFNNRTVRFGWAYPIILWFFIFLQMSFVGSGGLEFIQALYGQLDLGRLFDITFPFVFCLQVAQGIHFIVKNIYQVALKQKKYYSYLTPKIIIRVIFPSLLFFLLFLCGIRGIKISWTLNLLLAVPIILMGIYFFSLKPNKIYE